MKPHSGALRNVCRLRSLLSFTNFELHRIAFLQALVALGSDGAVVYKNVGAIRATDEPVSLGVIEPFNRAFQTFHVPPLSARLSVGGPKTCPHKMHFGAVGMGCQGEMVAAGAGTEPLAGTAWIAEGPLPTPPGLVPTLPGAGDRATAPTRSFSHLESCRSVPCVSRPAVKPCV